MCRESRRDIVRCFHRVDSPNTPTSKMARSLLAHHRWSVSKHLLPLPSIVTIQVRERHTVPPVHQRSRRHRAIFVSLHDDSTASHRFALAKQGQDPRRLSRMDHERSQIDHSTHIPSMFERSTRAIRYARRSRQRSSFHSSSLCRACDALAILAARTNVLRSRMESVSRGIQTRICASRTETRTNDR